MLKDKYSYIALFTYEDAGISIEFPDLPGCYPCADKDNTDEALKNAKEALGLHIWGMEQDHEIIPKPSAVTDLKLKPNQVSVLIEVLGYSQFTCIYNSVNFKHLVFSFYYNGLILSKCSLRTA